MTPRTATLNNILAGRTSVVVIAPHPDDETLGCGRLLADARARGIGCTVICVTDGARSHPQSRSHPHDVLVALRHAELIAAVDTLGRGIRIEHLGYPDCSAPQGGVAADRIAALVPPDACLLSPWQGDPHIDHVSCAALSAIVADRTGSRHLAYPIWGRVRPRIPPPPTGWHYTGSEDAADRKRLALACHRSQMTPLIRDDPDGFVMEKDLQDMFLREPEVFHAP